MSGHKVVRLKDVSLTRLSFLPGRSLTASVAGVAEVQEGRHAIVECEIHFDATRSATIDLECVPGPIVRDSTPWFTVGLGDGVSPTDSGVHTDRAIEFASGRIACNSGRRIVSLVRFELLSKEEEARFHTPK
jgi:hypothetical protein